MEDKREIDLEKLQKALEEKVSGTAKAQGGEEGTAPEKTETQQAGGESAENRRAGSEKQEGQRAGSGKQEGQQVGSKSAENRRAGSEKQEGQKTGNGSAESQKAGTGKQETQAAEGETGEDGRRMEALGQAAATIIVEGSSEKKAHADKPREDKVKGRKSREHAQEPGQKQTLQETGGRGPRGRTRREQSRFQREEDWEREEPFEEPGDWEESTELAEAARSVVVRLDVYRRKIWEARKRRWVRLALVAVVVLGVLFGVTQTVKYWTYSSYTRESAPSGEDTVSAYYQKVGERILKYSLDGVSLSEEDGTMLWSASYTMNAPVAVSCGEAVAIYDSQGTNIRIYDTTGEIGNVSTNIPIIKAKIARQGVVAAILESGEETWIQYYDTKGENIASIKTTLDSTGYPLDLALSTDGLLMAVSYLQIADGTPQTEVSFYNFSSIGQNQTDNLANSYIIENVIAPQVEYLDEQTCLLLREDGFSIYEGKQIPKLAEEVKLDREIISAFHSGTHVGFITPGEGERQYTLWLYNKSGREIFREDFDFAYESVLADDRQIVLYNSNQMCVYSLDGVKKFEGDIKEGMVSGILPVGANQYLLITEEGTCTIRLKR